MQDVDREIAEFLFVRKGTFDRSLSKPALLKHYLKITIFAVSCSNVFLTRQTGNEQSK